MSWFDLLNDFGFCLNCFDRHGIGVDYNHGSAVSRSQVKEPKTYYLSDPSQCSVLCESLEPRTLLSVDMLWANQFGNIQHESAYGVTVDGMGNAYITGYAKSDLEGGYQGGNDAFLSKFDSNGSKVWGKQFGTSHYESGNSVAADSMGNAYVTGYTKGNMEGVHKGSADAFLIKYDSDGNKIWGKQLGTSGYDSGRAVAVGGDGNVYVSGYTNGSLEGLSVGGYDVFLNKYDSNGNKVWGKQFGTNKHEFARDVVVDDNGNIYATGYTWGNLGMINAGGNDAFLIKYDTDGNQQWVKQIGTIADEFGYGVAVDVSGNAYITGKTNSDLEGINAGGNDIFLIKYDSHGNRIWGKQLGTSGNDSGYGVAVDVGGHAYVMGNTGGDLKSTNAGGNDVFLIKYDSDGNEIGGWQLGSSVGDSGRSVAVDGSGNAYISGRTRGDLAGTNAGNDDVFLAKWGESELCTTTIDDLESLVQGLNTKASVKKELTRILNTVEKQVGKGKHPKSISKVIVKLVRYSSNPIDNKYVPVDQANSLILESTKYLACLDGQSCAFMSTSFNDLRGVIDNLATSEKTKKKLGNILSRVELDGPTVELAERVGLTKLISTLVVKSNKLGIASDEANDLICQVASVMTRF